jgi:glycosyltransferase involved in cell wall biosynthesis
MASTEVSVVLAFRDAEADLGRQLTALAQQDFEGVWEVIAVDNGSSDRSRMVVDSHTDHVPIRVVEADERANLSYARNTGARSAAGRKLLFLDADDEVARGYVRAMASALDSAEFVAARLDHEALNPGWVRAAYGDAWQVHGLDPLFQFLPVAGGGTIGVTREVFEAVGGFDPDLSGAEDVAFAWNVQLQGSALRFVSDAVLRHRYRATLAGLFRQTRAQGRVLPLLYRMYRDAGLERRSLREAGRQWLSLLAGLPRVRGRSELAPLAARLGYLVGRLEGSVRYRVLAL